jgi:hypothetical protein
MENTNSDFKLNKEECKNLIEMIKSSDQSNHEMAKVILDSLEENDTNTAWVFIIIVYSGKDSHFWLEVKFYKMLNVRFGEFFQQSIRNANRSVSLTLLTTILAKTKDNSKYIELYLEMYLMEMKKGLMKFGYEVIGDLEIKAKT